MFSKPDRDILRQLAIQVKEISKLPEMRERQQLWKAQNRLERVRPAVFVSAEGAWRELLPMSKMQCKDPQAQKVEWNLRSRIYTFEHFHDDRVIRDTWIVPKRVTNSGWGLEPEFTPSSATGAWGYKPVIHGIEDLDRLRQPQVSYDSTGSQEDYEAFVDLFGDILDVQLKGVYYIEFHLMNYFCKLRGLDQVMLDMYDNPEMIHRAMSFLENGHRALIEQYRSLDLLEDNTDDPFHLAGDTGFACSGVTISDPIGNTSEKVTPSHMWASAEAQEMTHISPAMLDEFVLPYESRLLEPFGLTGYGCCEDLTNKLDLVIKRTPNLRRVSVSPWADVEKCAQKLEDRFVLSWKPHPGTLVGDFDEEGIERYIRQALEVTKGNIVEIVLKDTHTCDNRPGRFDCWTRIAKQLALEY